MTAVPRPAWVLNHHGQVCPLWVRGELHVRRTEPGAATVPHPESGEPLVGTGLSARRIPGDRIDQLSHPGGRARVRGLDLELGLVEHLIARHPDVGECAVQLDEAAGGSALRAYVAPSAVTPRALADVLADVLPEFLLPAHIVALPALPRRPDGTVDRAALRTTEPVTVTAAPASELEAVVRRIWAEVLGLPEDAIPLDRGFFDLGANSLLLVRVADRVHAETGRRLEIADYFRHLTIAALARALGGDHPHGADDVVTQSRSRAAARRAWLRARTAPAASAGEPVAGTAPAASAGEPVVVDLERRTALRARDLGVRRPRPGEPVVALPRIELPRVALAEINLRRASTREFAPTPVPFDTFAGLLHVLARRPAGDGFRCAYGSAGALYPVRLYAIVRDGRVRGLDGGGYYYQPALHQLLRIGDLAIPAAGVPPVNRAVFATAGWMFLLVAETAAIVPLYGRAEATGHCAIEAGLIAQLLEQAATAFGLGLCQVGGVVGDVPALLGLEPTELHLHSLLGGAHGDAGGTDPRGTDPRGTDPRGTDPRGTDPRGTDPRGTDQ